MKTDADAPLRILPMRETLAQAQTHGYRQETGAVHAFPEEQGERAGHRKRPGSFNKIAPSPSEIIEASRFADVRGTRCSVLLPHTYPRALRRPRRLEKPLVASPLKKVVVYHHEPAALAH